MPAAATTAKNYRLVIFDMDGTLTEEMLDFAQIRRDLGLAPGGILEQLADLPPERRRHAETILHRHELAAAEACRVHEGAVELLAALAGRNIRTALLTRNSVVCTQRILARHNLHLDYVATREDLPHKPHPDSILNITRRMAIAPLHTLMVGDYLYDVEAARNAGTDMALVCVKPELPAFSHLATYRIRRLGELLAIVDSGGDNGEGSVKGAGL